MSQKCSTEMCRYGSFMTSAHPCKNKKGFGMICQHPRPETMQEEYQRLISQLGGKDIFLPKPILFRQTPHSRDVKISTIWINENIETFYGDGKFAVMQTLRLMVSRIQPNLFPACGK